jgi:hypothetical protein
MFENVDDVYLVRGKAPGGVPSCQHLHLEPSVVSRLQAITGQHVNIKPPCEDLNLDLRNCALPKPTRAGSLQAAKQPQPTGSLGSSPTPRAQRQALGARIGIALGSLPRYRDKDDLEASVPIQGSKRVACLRQHAQPVSAAGGVIQMEAGLPISHRTPQLTTAMMEECTECYDFATKWRLKFEVSVFIGDFQLSAKNGCSGCAIIATGVELCCRPCLDPVTGVGVVPYWVRMSKRLPVNYDASSTTSLGAHRGIVQWSGDQLRNRDFDTSIEFFIPKGTPLPPNCLGSSLTELSPQVFALAQAGP